MKRQGVELIPITDTLRNWILDEYKNGMTQTDLAARCGVSDRILRTIVNGTRHRNGKGFVSPGGAILVDTADKIACATGHHLSELEEDAA